MKEEAESWEAGTAGERLRSCPPTRAYRPRLLLDFTAPFTHRPLRVHHRSRAAASRTTTQAGALRRGVVCSEVKEEVAAEGRRRGT